MQTKGIALLLFILCSSCEYSYDIDILYEPQVVVNSIINPDSVIKVDVVWSNEIGDKADYKPVDLFSAEIYENNILILEGNFTSGRIITNTYPKEGAIYKLKLEVEGYGELSAETVVPQACDATIKFVERRGEYYSYNDSFIGYYFYELEEVRVSETIRSVMMRCYGLYENNDKVFTYDYYGNNPMLDDFNKASGVYCDEELIGSNTSYQSYARIPNANLNKEISFIFSIKNYDKSIEGDTFIDEDGYVTTTEYMLTDMVIQFISPSYEYDKYYKDRYLQTSLSGTEPPIFNQVVPIYSNINGGLGIFAAYNSLDINFNPDNDEQD